jgi:hypothetical protein
MQIYVPSGNPVTTYDFVFVDTNMSSIFGDFSYSSPEIQCRQCFVKPIYKVIIFVHKLKIFT